MAQLSIHAIAGNSASPAAGHIYVLLIHPDGRDTTWAHVGWTSKLARNGWARLGDTGLARRWH